MTQTQPTNFYLSRIKLFDGIPKNALGGLKSVCTLEEVSARTRISVPPRTLLAIHGGRVYRVSPDNEAVMTHWGHAGDLLGLSDMTSESSTYVCAAPTLLTRLPVSGLAELAKICELGLWQRIAEMTAVEAAALARRATSLILYPLPRRLALALVDLIPHSQETDRGWEVFVTHQELAWRTGATRESISAVLAKFEAIDVLRRESRAILLCNAARLERLALGTMDVDAMVDKAQKGKQWARDAAERTGRRVRIAV